MEEITSHKPGTFCWVDLATTDTDGAKQFYGSVFGWEAIENNFAEGVVYIIMRMHGKPVAAIAPMNEELRKMNIQPHWMSYISVENADDSIKKAKELGGNVSVEAMDVAQEGRMGLIQDPEGAYLGLWQAKNYIGASFKDTPGALCWVEHGSHGSTETIPFYEKLFGWAANTKLMGEMNYTTFMMGDKAVAGLYKLPDYMADVPQHWLPYFMTDNIDVTIEKATKAGGKILMPKTMAEGVGFFAVIGDPQGGVFGVVAGNS